MYVKYVCTPTTSDEIGKHMDEFKLTGLPGACGSSHATYIIHKMCSHRIARVCKGFKIKHPSQTYNLTANHHQEILATTDGHSGSFNDKTVVIYDDFICVIKIRDIFNDYKFEIFWRQGEKKSVTY